MTLPEILLIATTFAALAAGCSGTESVRQDSGAAAISRVIVFGDSLSDSGAAHALTGRMLAEKFSGAFAFPAPASAYPRGHWSNGPTAVSHFATLLPAPIDNYALGGATTGRALYDSAAGTPPLFDRWFAKDGGGVQGQIARYLADRMQAAARPERNALFVIFASWNDYFRFSDYKLPGTPVDVADQAVANLRTAFESLHGAGAKRFLFVNSPSAPVLGKLQDNVRFDQFKRRFNGGLAALAAELATAHRDVEITLFDAYAADRAILAEAAKYGFSTADTPCQPVFSVPRPPPPPCTDPDRHYYWDELHPSARAHQLLGIEMFGLYR